ncbi:hypothetical protein IX51_01265 [uncultured archaeon]|nr:hypothetical protein IX51_01265 [uncultured archaeon]
MEISAFLKIVENEYMEALRKFNSKWEKNGKSPPSFVDSADYGDLNQFKQWFAYALEVTEINSSEPTTPEEIIYRAALHKSSINPEKPVYPRIISALSLFQVEELAKMFGRERADELAYAIKEHLES